MNTHITALPQRKPRTKADIASFLRNHCRYSTLNPWNGVSSYAVNIKVSRLHLTHEQRLACYDLMQCAGAYEESGFNATLNWFDHRHNFRWQAGINGRSGGYAVLYQGSQSPSGRRTVTGAGTDEAEDFDAWDLRSLKERLTLVWDFDETIEDACAQFVSYALTTQPLERTIFVPRTILVPAPRTQAIGLAV